LDGFAAAETHVIAERLQKALQLEGVKQKKPSVGHFGQDGEIERDCDIA
jgi:hypothetical protein